MNLLSFCSVRLFVCLRVVRLPVCLCCGSLFDWFVFFYGLHVRCLFVCFRCSIVFLVFRVIACWLLIVLCLCVVVFVC